MKKYIYLGVDQTGAIDSKGRPRPLPACLIRDDEVSFFYLSTFSKTEIIRMILPAKSVTILICVDCVLGLPDELNMTWRAAIKEIRNTTQYGRQAAIDYFREMGKGQVLRRKIEIACHANSIFTEKPYQKNIQTGTFRIWKDISLNENDFIAPAVERIKSEKKVNYDSIAIYEGYPSLSWRLLFNATTRQPRNLSLFIKNKRLRLKWNRKHQTCVDLDSNFADAFVLALTMKKFRKKAIGLRPQNEGWILGHPSL